MLRLTRKTDYALVALARLAEHAGPEPMSARELAEGIHAPRALLTAVLKQLQHAGLVSSRRGVHGGYALSRAPEAINMLEVIAAVEGPVQLTLCCGDEHDDEVPCSIEAHCQIGTQVQRLNQRLNAFLEETFLADLIERPRPVEIANRGRSTFSISGARAGTLTKR